MTNRIARPLLARVSVANEIDVAHRLESHHAYQQYAEECLRWADEADSEQHRELFLSMARAWTQADLILKGVMIPKSKSESASLPSLEDDF